MASTSIAPLANKFGLALKEEVEERRQKYNTDMTKRKMPRPLVFLSEGERTAYMRNRCEQAKHTDDIAFYKVENKAFLRDMKRAHNVLAFQKKRFDSYVARSKTPSATKETPPSLVIQPINDFGKTYYAFYVQPSATVPKNAEVDGQLMKNSSDFYSLIRKCVEEIRRAKQSTEDTDTMDASGDVDGDARATLNDNRDNVSRVETSRSDVSISAVTSANDNNNNSNTSNSLTITGKRISPRNKSQRPKSTIGFLETPKEKVRPKTACGKVGERPGTSRKRTLSNDGTPRGNDDSFAASHSRKTSEMRGQSARYHREYSSQNNATNDHVARCKTAPPGGRRVDFDRSILSSERRPQIFDRSKAAYYLRQELKKPRKKIVAKKQDVDIEEERKVERARWAFYQKKVAGFNQELAEMKKRHTSDINKWLTKEVEEKLNL